MSIGDSSAGLEEPESSRSGVLFRLCLSGEMAEGGDDDAREESDFSSDVYVSLACDPAVSCS